MVVFKKWYYIIIEIQLVHLRFTCINIYIYIYLIPQKHRVNYEFELIQVIRIILFNYTNNKNKYFCIVKRLWKNIFKKCYFGHLPICFSRFENPIRGGLK